MSSIKLTPNLNANLNASAIPCDCKSLAKSKKSKAMMGVMIIILLLLSIILIGYLGYRYIFKMNASDAFFNTTITASTLGLDIRERTPAEKIFTGVYALLAGVFFIAIISSAVSYIFTSYFLDG